MNPDASLPPDAREARLTALLHGELSAPEAEVLRGQIAADAVLAALFRRLSLAHGLARETVRSPEPKELSKPEPLQLAPERRAALLAKFKAPPAEVVRVPAFARKAWADRRELLALAAMLVAVVTSAGLLLPSLAKAKAKSQRVAAVNSAKMAEWSDGLEREALPDATADAPAPSPAQIGTLVEPILARRRDVVPAEKRQLAETTPAIRADPAPAVVSANSASFDFGVAAKVPTVAAPAPVTLPESLAAMKAGHNGQATGHNLNSVTLSLSSDGGIANQPRPELQEAAGSEAKSNAGNVGGGFGGGGRQAAWSLSGATANADFIRSPAAERELAVGQSGSGGAVPLRDHFHEVDRQSVAAQALGYQPEAAHRGEPADEFARRGLDRTAGVTLRGRGAIQAGEPVHFFAEVVPTTSQLSDAPSQAAAPVNGPVAFEREELTRAGKALDVLAERSVTTLGTVVSGEDFGTKVAVAEPAVVARESEARFKAKTDANYGFVAPAAADKSGSLAQGLGGQRRLAAGLQEADAAKDRFDGVQTEAKLEKLGDEDSNGNLPAAEPETLAKGIAARPAKAGIVEVQAQSETETNVRPADDVTPLEVFAITGSRLVQSEPAVAEVADRKSLLGEVADRSKNLVSSWEEQPVTEQKRLAEVLELGQQVAAYKPVELTKLQLGLATNGAPAALRDTPMWGRVFKGVEVREKVADSKSDGVLDHDGDQPLPKLALGAPESLRAEVKEQRDLDTLRRLRDILATKVTEEALDGAISKRSPVEVIDEAMAEPAPDIGLLSKLRTKLGGDATRIARLKVERDTPDIQLLGYASGNQTYDPNFLQTEFEKIKSRRVLGKAAEKLNLPATEDTVRQLEGKLSVSQYRNTGIVEIQAKDADPAKAAEIANAVARAYEEYRVSNRAEQNPRRLEVLKLQFEEASKQVAAKERSLAQVAQPVSAPVREPDAPLPKLAPGAPEPQPEVTTADNAFSTFSLNVSDVSFKLAAAALEKGQMPEPATVRTEEFINAFDYRDPEPASGAPVAFAWERARYPFAHDRDLVRFSVKTAASGRQPGRPLNLVLLLDNSGSMERADRVRIRQECLRVLAGQLQPQDRVSVVAFARRPRLWVDGLAGAQAAELPGRVGELTPDGGTNLEEALRTAYQTAARHFAANGVNRVVLLTDGAANLGDVQPDSLKQQVETNRRQGIALDCFGIGWEGLNDELLEVLSRNGDGRYGFVNTPEAAQSEFAGQLVGALQIAASDVKVQVEWNPKRVTAYRQLGYAKHQLKKEQFRDNTVDAAEIGAAEAGNALYTVQVNPAGEGPLGTVRVRFRVPGTDDYREHEWPLHYEGTARALDQAGPALRLAAGASAFSEWLVSSPWAAEVTPDRLLGLLKGVTDTYAADPRPKQLLQMLQQAKSVSGK